jgi:hypothetical protein
MLSARSGPCSDARGHRSAAYQEGGNGPRGECAALRMWSRHPLRGEARGNNLGFLAFFDVEPTSQRPAARGLRAAPDVASGWDSSRSWRDNSRSRKPWSLGRYSTVASTPSYPAACHTSSTERAPIISEVPVPLDVCQRPLKERSQDHKPSTTPA